MALPSPRLTEPLPDLLAVDDALIAHPAAQRALRMGLLEARRAALVQARSLIAWGRPLLVAIIAVSFLHLWDTIAAIRPAAVPELALPGWRYHATAAALTLAIDAAALFCLAAGAMTSRAGERLRRSLGLGFFLVTTFLLNAAFVVRYAPALGVDVRARVLPGLELLFAILLPATVPVGLFAVEGALARLEGARLRLLMDRSAVAGKRLSHRPGRYLQVPDYGGRGRRPTLTQPQPQADWQDVRVVKARAGYRLTAVHSTVVYGDPDEILAQVGGHTADVERRNRTARQMNRRLVRKTLSYSEELEAVEAAGAWEDWVYNLTRTVDTLAIPDRDEQGRRRWQRQTPAMEAGLTDHRWTITELLTTVVAPRRSGRPPAAPALDHHGTAHHRCCP